MTEIRDVAAIEAFPGMFSGPHLAELTHALAEASDYGTFTELFVKADSRRWYRVETVQGPERPLLRYEHTRLCKPPRGPAIACRRLPFAMALQA